MLIASNMGIQRSATKTLLLPEYSEASYIPIAKTVAQFLDSYSKGDKNLTELPCPTCLKINGFLAPPDCYRESLRIGVVERYLKIDHWQNRVIFQHISSQIRHSVGGFGISVSLIHRQTTYVKFESKLEFKELPRVVSLDAHALLSRGGLVLLDASKDWRTSQNPLVTGPPKIRFYAGVTLVTHTGVAIGVLSVFDDVPREAFSATKLRSLAKVASHLMSLLDTPLDRIVMCDEKLLPENPNAGDVELAELSSRLGRATCSGGHMTIFERDGSGSCYSHSHIFKLSHYEEHKQISENLISDNLKLEIRQALRRVKTLKTACRLITKSIANHQHFDCVIVMEIRFMEKHRVARANLPDNITHPSQGIPQRLQKSIIAKSKFNSERCKVRVLASSIPEYDLSTTDHRIWQEAFASECGCEIIGANGSTIYNSGIIMPFFVSKPNFIKKMRRKPGDDSVEIYLRSGGYLIGAFNKTSNRSYITPNLVSKVYDHIKIARMIYLNK